MAARSKTTARRDRVLVDLTGQRLLLAGVSGVYHRGRRLRDLALLGLAAERQGLRCELTEVGVELVGLPVPHAVPCGAEHHASQATTVAMEAPGVLADMSDDYF